MMQITDLIELKHAILTQVDNLSLKDKIIQNKEIITPIRNLGRSIEGLDIGPINASVTYYDEIYAKSVANISALRSFAVTLETQADQLYASRFSVDLKQFFHDCLYVSNNPNVVKLLVSATTDEFIRTRLHSYNNWHYPSLMYGCKYHNYINQMVTGDPLYVTDPIWDLVEQAIAPFPDLYQRRIRAYKFDNQNFPIGQFGFIFSWNFFNYITLDEMPDYLNKIYNWLRPGGVFIFSYNNTDIPRSAYTAERQLASWAPKRKVLPLVKSAGFEIVDSQDRPTDDALFGYTSWLEVKKPGDLTTVKASQAVGLICEK